MVSILIESWEITTRILAYGTLVFVDLILIGILANYLSGRRSIARPLALGMLIFVFGQFIRSGSMFLQYMMAYFGLIAFDTEIGTVGLTIAPFVVIIGAALMTLALTRPPRKWIIAIWLMLLMITPVLMFLLKSLAA